jgi:hypothetical protein
MVISYEAQCKLALQGASFDWAAIPIGRNDGGLVADAKQFLGPDWWKRAEPAGIRDINDLLRSRGMGTLRDDTDKENVHAGEPGMTASEVAEYQHEKEKGKREESTDQLEPEENETIASWFGRLAVHVNNSNKLFLDGLRSYASRFPGNSSARKTLDAKVVAEFLQKLR